MRKTCAKINRREDIILHLTLKKHTYILSKIFHLIFRGNLNLRESLNPPTVPYVHNTIKKKNQSPVKFNSTLNASLWASDVWRYGHNVKSILYRTRKKNV